MGAAPRLKNSAAAASQTVDSPRCPLVSTSAHRRHLMGRSLAMSVEDHKTTTKRHAIHFSAAGAISWRLLLAGKQEKMMDACKPRRIVKLTAGCIGRLFAIKWLGFIRFFPWASSDVNRAQGLYLSNEMQGR
jgi:hypothetical protein